MLKVNSRAGTVTMTRTSPLGEDSVKVDLDLSVGLEDRVDDVWVVYTTSHRDREKPAWSYTKITFEALDNARQLEEGC